MSLPRAKTKRPTSSARRARRDGFTLLELLIVGVLMSVLMLGVWSLFRTWSGLYEKGQRRTLEAQLTRSLCDQFTDDLRSVTHVPTPAGSGRRSSSSPRTGAALALAGSSDWLILDVLQPANPFRDLANAAEDSDPDVMVAMPQAPEIQRVIYTFVPPATDPDLGLLAGDPSMGDDTASVEISSPLYDDIGMAEPFYGLLRVVVAREYFDQVAAANSPMDMQPAAGTSHSGGDSAKTPGVLEQDEIPEVDWMEFRYYDGASWSSSWDSRSQGKLPVAVEMRFELAEFVDPADVGLSGDDDSVAVDDELMLPQDELMSSATDMAYGAEVDMMGMESGTEETPYPRCIV